ncbi:MAG: laccase domain-containing protein, partial [Pseudomonadota bacterium]
VKTADCLPVLIASTNGAFVAAVHAGWRGFASGILINALKIAHSNQAVNTLRVVVGPAISRQKFEVGPEVVEAMQAVECGLSDEVWGITVSKGRNDRWHVDLPVAAALQMMIAGIKPNHIEVIQSCTVTSQKENQCLWASYRREGKACGSNWTWIRGR